MNPTRIALHELDARFILNILIFEQYAMQLIEELVVT